MWSVLSLHAHLVRCKNCCIETCWCDAGFWFVRWAQLALLHEAPTDAQPDLSSKSTYLRNHVMKILQNLTQHLRSRAQHGQVRRAADEFVHTQHEVTPVFRVQRIRFKLFRSALFKRECTYLVNVCMHIRGIACIVHACTPWQYEFNNLWHACAAIHRHSLIKLSQLPLNTRESHDLNLYTRGRGT